MKIYLAAQFKEQPLMLQWSILLKHHGHYITSRWLMANEAKLKSIEAYNEAMKDLEDIDNCDIFISQTLNRGDVYTGGGRHIEFGYALAKGKKLINVGGSESVFHTLAITIPTIEEVLQHLK